MIYVCSSSSELQERTASNSYGYSTEDLDSDEDYVMEGESQEENDGYSYSTEIADENPDDGILVDEEKPVDGEKLDELTETFAKTPEIFPRGRIPEENNKNPDHEIKLSNFRQLFSGIGWFLFKLLRVVVIFALCLQVDGMISKNYGRRLIIPKFTIESVSVFPIQLDPVSRDIIAGWNMIFNVRNPSENYVLSYSNITAEVYFGKNPLHHVWPLLPGLNEVIPPWMTDKSIWETAVPDFSQTQAHQNLVKVTFASFPVGIDNATATSLVKEINSGTSRGFSVRLNGNITQNKPKGLNRDTGSFSAHCPLNMAFLQTGGVMASSSDECKVVTGGLDGWMVLAISIFVVHATLRTCYYLSNRYLGSRGTSECCF